MSNTVASGAGVDDGNPPRISVILPCLNEAGSIIACVEEAQLGLSRAGLPGEVLVVDNGSVDGSADLARQAGARVVDEAVPGYGSALRAGVRAAEGDILVMADADLTYDLTRAWRTHRARPTGHGRFGCRGAARWRE